MKVRIIQAYIKHSESKLTASEIAKYCKSSIPAVTYQLKQLTDTSILIPETNEVLKKTYYYINDFFLKQEYLDQARLSLHPFIHFFVDYFHFPDVMSDKDIEKDIIEFIHIIAWLFTEDTKNDFDNSKNGFE